MSPVEDPSGKNASSENFPVGSWLLPPHLRRHVFVYYAFARAVDDIADSDSLDAAEKIRRLNEYEKAINDKCTQAGHEKADAMRASLAETGVSVTYCTDLIAAFKQDAIKDRYDSWQDLLDYCRLSAVPVGRYMIDLHGSSHDRYHASDALCSALQIINHLQDLKADYLKLDRIYLPRGWMREAGVCERELSGGQCSTGLRATIDRTLKGINDLLKEAAGIERTISSRRLSIEASIILYIARALSAKLSRMDPVKTRVELSKTELTVCMVRGILSAAV